MKGRPEYAGSSVCKRAQAQHRMKYGAKVLKKRARSKAEDEASVPQRSDKGKRRTLRPGRMAKYLQQKAVQAKEKQNAISCVDELVIKKLKEIKEGPSDMQLKAKKTATDNVDKKRIFIGEMLKPQSQALKRKNEEQVEKHVKQVAARKKFHVASLHHNALKEKRLLVAEDCKMFGAQLEDWPEDTCKNLFVERRCMQKFLRRSPEKKKLWFSQHARLLNDSDWQQKLVDQKLLNEDMALLGWVVFGGYLVDETWVKACCLNEGSLLEKELLVEPVWKLVGSMKKESTGADAGS